MADYDINVVGTTHVDVDELVPVDVASLPDLTITEIGAMGPLTLAGIPDHYTVAISALPDLNVRIREIPSIRAHIPANFHLGFSILGVELAALDLCGEAQIITEPFVPNPCERCSPVRIPQDRPDRPDQPPPPAITAVMALAKPE